MTLPEGDTSSGEPTIDPSERRKYVMEEARSFLEQDLVKIFASGEPTRARYSPTIRFEDPITSYNDLDGYTFNMKLLKSLFNIDFKLHSMEVTGDDAVTARWTMNMEMWLLPWKPNLLFTGRTFYKVDLPSGLITSHIDVWDALRHNRFLSVEAVQHVLRMFMQVQLKPAIESHKYDVLLKFKDHEIRNYPPYIVAETDQPTGSGPASGSGFQDLAQYLFGGNREKVSMEMTTPVLSSIQREGNQSTAIQFVMEDHFKDVSQLPTPIGMRVTRRQLPGGFFGAAIFSGWPLDFEVVQAERALRDVLLRNGHTPKAGYTLARYNDPTTLPAVRRNEVLIEVEGFVWPPSSM
ncbi:hypothetical protein FOA52_011149 [Chlamydomonas sp. UWO 241]|nr:hypothetical protein FOA52_011149 [Chlamydomonas sp. UWO 241]